MGLKPQQNIQCMYIYKCLTVKANPIQGGCHSQLILKSTKMNMSWFYKYCDKLCEVKADRHLCCMFQALTSCKIMWVIAVLELAFHESDSYENTLNKTSWNKTENSGNTVSK